MESISICNDKGILFLKDDPDETDSFELAQSVFSWLLKDQYKVDYEPAETWDDVGD